VTNPPVQAGDLFVFYGLLKLGAAGQPADLPLGTAGAFGAPCRFRGQMVDLGGFPGVVAGNALCHGIRWILDDVSIIGPMDEFEDVTDDPATSLYIRTRIPLCDDSGNMKPAKPPGFTCTTNRSRDFSHLWPMETGRSTPEKRENDSFSFPILRERR
jgi:hypothetical protein